MISTKPSSKRLLIPVLTFAWVAGLSGCSITALQHNELQEPPIRQSGVVSVERQATGFSGGRVGWGRISIFAIPVAPVRIESDEASDLMDVVRNALATAGYTTQPADSQQSDLVLKAHVDYVRFNNYTWLAPLIITWGDINVTLRLEAADGRVHWERSFESSGNSFNITDGFNVSATKSVTELADSMVEAFSGEEFNAALVETLASTE